MKKLLYILILVIIGSACAKVEKRCVGLEDNSKIHYVRGMEALENKRLDVAEQKFERALYCEFEKISNPYGGLAIVYAYKALQEKDPKFAGVQADRSIKNLKMAEDKASSKEDKFEYGIAGMRVYTIVKGKDWLEKVENYFDDIKKLELNENKLDYYQGRDAAYYFMGEAYLEAKEFSKARDKFREVLEMKKQSKWHEKADKAWKRLSKLERAIAGMVLGEIGKKLAQEEKITRAALTALLVGEMKLDKILAGRIPVKSQLDAMKAEFTPADVLNHSYKDEVLTLMKFNVRGLEPNFDATTKAYLFKPDSYVTRKEFAFILEDILAKITGDEKLFAAYLGNQKSPYPDVAPTSPWYNSVMNAVTRGLMESELSGEFRPDDPIDGAEALLAIRMLKQRVNIN